MILVGAPLHDTIMIMMITIDQLFKKVSLPTYVLSVPLIKSNLRITATINPIQSPTIRTGRAEEAAVFGFEIAIICTR